MSSTTLIDRYRCLLNSLKVIAIDCGRDPQQVSLLVVSKGYCWSQVAPLYHAGQRTFGENRLPELLQKASEAPKDVEWHFIGPLQKNKVRKVLEVCSCIHSVNSLELAQKIASCALETKNEVNVFLQVNTSGEAAKQGMTEQECEEMARAYLDLPSLHIEGLMTMAPLTKDLSVIKNSFSRLRLLRDRLQLRYGSNYFSQLSMGMSQDYPQAVIEGSTLVRVGSSLFA